MVGIVLMNNQACYCSEPELFGHEHEGGVEKGDNHHHLLFKENTEAG
jgi:hypothetical protein